ncbi:sensor histidine kinase [Marinagarivorans cellulosilyticus]|uniref:Signal transduction histidine kinase internal region domain-containing protein n=1 Tax=Marinagarivorans cellulosilyticus TaxID=2721545 RepID=A0AAN1WIF9_9GAMM|nr:histidine kinase [Marinagarivorans cellulosilyticus]BCD98135.1 hypothetical protein MARGE09_P2336 [Marinagarivorans cellulosilyticus]
MQNHLDAPNKQADTLPTRRESDAFIWPLKRNATRILHAIIRLNLNHYWLVQTSAWLWYFAFILITITLTSGRAVTNGTIHAILETLAGFAISHFLALTFQSLRIYPAYIQGVAVIAFTLAGSALWNLFKWVTFNALFNSGFSLPSLSQFGDWYSFSLAIFIAWCSAYFAIFHYSLLTREREKSLRLEAATKDAQLKMLRYQLNPHFIKNTLNAISTLILKQENDQAYATLEKLSNFLSHTIYNDPQELVTLEHEIEALNEYIAIEKVRFSDQLFISINFDDDARFCLLPNLILQPLIENAVKYGSRGAQKVTRIHLSAEVIAKELIVVISDNGPGLDLPPTTHKQRKSLGITLTLDRLQAHFGDKSSIEFDNLQPAGLAVTLIMPARFDSY